MANLQLAKNLKYLRKKNNYNQMQLGELLNISRQAYSNYERCERTPDLDSLIRIAQAHNVTLDQLVNQNLNTLVSDEWISYTPAVNAPAIKPLSENTLYLSDTEVSLIMTYRDLTDEGQQILDGFLKSQTEIKEKR